MSQQTYAPVIRSVTVAASQQRAFAVFTEQFGTWWPPEYSIGEADMADFVLEPRVGGRWYEVGVDGSECDCGRVTAFEPPERLTLAWQLNGSWQYDPDPDHASEVEVRFIAEGSASTRVELEHRNFERHGEGAPAVHGGVDDPQGWTYCLDLFAKAAA
jgi:uncharacterized protein YndB with AHSA1/START domain